MKIAVWTGAEIYTAPLLRLDFDQRWARTFSALYRLNLPAPGVIMLADEELRRAIEHKRELTLTKPWRFEPPDWSRR